MLLSWATFSFKWFYLFIFGRAGSPLPHGLFSSRGGQGLLSTCRRVGFSLWGLLLFWSMDSRVHRLQQFSTWAQQLWLPGSRAQAQQLWRTDLEAPWHAGSSWIRDQTHVSCIGRWILYHWATREAPQTGFMSGNSRLPLEAGLCPSCLHLPRAWHVTQSQLMLVSISFSSSISINDIDCPRARWGAWLLVGN